MAWFYVLFALVCLPCVPLVLIISKYRKHVEQLKNLPGFRPRFLIGNLYEFGFLKPRETKRLVSDFFYARLGVSTIFHQEGLYVVWIGPMPILFITRAKTAEIILNSSVLIERSKLYDALADSLGTGLITSKGDKWRQDRKLITPAFHYRILDEFLDVMNGHSTILVDILRQKIEGNKWFNPEEAFNNCVLDIILETSVGMHGKSHTGTSEYVSLVKRSIEMIIDRIHSPWFHSSIYYLFPVGWKYWKLKQEANRLVDEIIDKKIADAKTNEEMESVPKRKIFIDILLEGEISRQELRDQINTFVVSGYHAVGSFLCWSLYLLGLHKDIQSNLFEEVSRIFPGGDVENVTKENLRDLKYMDCVIKECQRLYPPLPDVARLITEDTDIGGYHVPKGTDCVISIAAIHRDPDIYPDPDRFDPDRFSPENSEGRSQFAHIPFSAGPRNCIGQRYANMKTKVILCHIIGNFTVHSLDPEDKVILCPQIVARNLEPWRFVFGTRKHYT